jgi:Tol biopolymer transport system component
VLKTQSGDAMSARVRHRGSVRTKAPESLIARLLVGVGALLLLGPGSESSASESAGPAAQAASPLQGLAFVRGRSIQNQHVMKTLADGSVMRLVRGFDPAWSPDGRELAYLALRPVAPSAGMESDIFVVSADGRHRRRISNDPSQEWDIQWSPDGAQIAYSDNNPEGGGRDVFVTDRGGRLHRRLTRTASICEIPTGWSRDGKWVQVTTCATNTRSERRASDGKKRPPATPDGSLSPNGKWIAYVTHESGTNRLYVASRDGTNARLIASVEGSRPSWSPDSRLLAFQGDARDGCGATEYRAQIFVIAAEPDSKPTPRDCIAAWERTPAWQPVRR